MAKPAKLHAALPKIARYFEQQPERLFMQKQLATILGAHREEWGLPARLSAGSFISLLLAETPLRELKIVTDRPAPEGATASPATLIRYSWGDVSPFKVALSLRPESYLSHGTAVFLHGLTDQLPHTIYVNREQTPKPAFSSGPLTQQSVDLAFKNAARVSTAVARLGDYRIVQLSGKNTGRLEMTQIADDYGQPIDVTKLERTLIDIAVRPAYAGGLFQVLEAYKAAAPRISIPTLVATLKKLGHVYPYHQSIGFLLQRAGVAPERLERLRELGLGIDFYAANQIPEPEYNQDWRLFVPKGLQ